MRSEIKNIPASVRQRLAILADTHWVARADDSLLVELFLWEELYDEAWQEASAGGCSDSLWLRIAATREDKHPADAVAIYKEMIVTVLRRANNSAYKRQ